MSFLSITPSLLTSQTTALTGAATVNNAAARDAPAINLLNSVLMTDTSLSLISLVITVNAWKMFAGWAFSTESPAVTAEVGAVF
jgi:hypothetical protein